MHKISWFVYVSSFAVMNQKLLRILIWCFKNVLSVSIIILVLSPKTIHREKLPPTNENFETQFHRIDFHPRHLFCDIPKLDQPFAENEDLLALNLPNGTLITEELREFGRCIAKSKLDPKSTDLCSCRKKTSYILLFASSVTAFFVDYVRYCVLPVICQCFRSMDSLFSYHLECFVLVVGILWFVVACVSTVFHINWLDEIWLPDEIYSQNYFERPILWTLAVILAFVSCIVCVVEFAFIKWRRSKLMSKNNSLKNGSPKRQIIKSTSTEMVATKVEIHKPPSPVVEDSMDTWSIASYPAEIKERLTWRACHKKWNKTWP